MNETFTTRQVSDTSGIPYQVINNLITNGSLTPLKRGRKGGNGSHLFSKKQIDKLTEWRSLYLRSKIALSDAKTP